MVIAFVALSGAMDSAVFAEQLQAPGRELMGKGGSFSFQFSKSMGGKSVSASASKGGDDKEGGGDAKKEGGGDAKKEGGGDDKGASKSVSISKSGSKEGGFSFNFSKSGRKLLGKEASADINISKGGGDKKKVFSFNFSKSGRKLLGKGASASIKISFSANKGGKDVSVSAEKGH